MSEIKQVPFRLNLSNEQEQKAYFILQNLQDKSRKQYIVNAIVKYQESEDLKTLFEELKKDLITAVKEEPGETKLKEMKQNNIEFEDLDI